MQNINSHFVECVLSEQLSMSHCQNFVAPPLSRREMLNQCANGFGAVALAAMVADGERAASAANGSEGRSATHGTHFEPKVRNVIFLYMDGGVSQVDSFDPKPELDKQNGKPFPAKIEKTQFNNIGNSLASP